MTLLSTNFLLARVAAFFMIFMIGIAVAFFTGLFFNFDTIWMYVSGLVVTAFLGAFNVLEPKAIEMEYQKFEKLLENYKKDHF